MSELINSKVTIRPGRHGWVN